jgi:hypothetical protein
MEHVAMDRVRVDRFLWLASGISVAVGIVHLLVSPEYFGEWWGYGFFFIYAGLIQIAYALAIFVQPSLQDPADAAPNGPHSVMPAVYRGGAVGNLAIIALYIVTRTVGIPFLGPDAGAVEPVTLVSVMATGAELILVIVLLKLARQGEGGRGMTV